MRVFLNLCGFPLGAHIWIRVHLAYLVCVKAYVHHTLVNNSWFYFESIKRKLEFFFLILSPALPLMN